MQYDIRDSFIYFVGVAFWLSFYSNQLSDSGDVDRFYIFGKMLFFNIGT